MLNHELQTILAAWPTLSAETRKAVVVLVTMDRPAMALALAGLILVCVKPSEEG